MGKGQFELQNLLQGNGGTRVPQRDAGIGVGFEGMPWIWLNGCSVDVFFQFVPFTATVDDWILAAIFGHFYPKYLAPSTIAQTLALDVYPALYANIRHRGKK